MKKLLILILLCPLLISSQKIRRISTIRLNIQNSVTLRGVIYPLRVNKIIRKLKILNYFRGKYEYPIYLVLDSPGGDVKAGLHLINEMKKIPNLHTITISSASMAAFIVQYHAGRRYVISNGLYMFHHIAFNLIDYTTKNLRRAIPEIEEYEKEIQQNIIERIKISRADYLKLITQDWWLSSKQAIKYNIADRIIKIKCSKSLTRLMETEYMVSYGTIETFSGCPIN